MVQKPKKASGASENGELQKEEVVRRLMLLRALFICSTNLVFLCLFDSVVCVVN